VPMFTPPIAAVARRRSEDGAPLCRALLCRLMRHQHGPTSREYLGRTNDRSVLSIRLAWHETNRGARSDSAMCEVYNAQVVHYVVDRALQVRGSLGYSFDMPPVTIATEELKRYRGVVGWPGEHIPIRLETARARFAHLLKASV
jgi:hypothetical protein